RDGRAEVAPLGRPGGEQEGEERVVVGLGRPHAVVALRLLGGGRLRRAVEVPPESPVDLHGTDATRALDRPVKGPGWPAPAAAPVTRGAGGGGSPPARRPARRRSAGRSARSSARRPPPGPRRPRAGAAWRRGRGSGRSARR